MMVMDKGLAIRFTSRYSDNRAVRRHKCHNLWAFLTIISSRSVLFIYKSLDHFVRGFESLSGRTVVGCPSRNADWRLWGTVLSLSWRERYQLQNQCHWQIEMCYYQKRKHRLDLYTISLSTERNIIIPICKIIDLRTLRIKWRDYPTFHPLQVQFLEPHFQVQLLDSSSPFSSYKSVPFRSQFATFILFWNTFTISKVKLLSEMAVRNVPLYLYFWITCLIVDETLSSVFFHGATVY